MQSATVKWIHFLTSVFLLALLFLIVTEKTNEQVIARSYDRSGVSRLEVSGQGDVHDYVFSAVLPGSLEDDDTILYYTSHRTFEAYIDGKRVYTLVNGSGTDGHTTGYVWNFVPLRREYGGKKIEIHISAIGKEGYPDENFLIGTQRACVLAVVRDNIFKWVLGSIIFVTGIVFLMTEMVLVRDRQAQVGLSFHYFSLFSILLGIWSMGESRLFELFYNCSLDLVFVNHMTFMLLPVIFALYIREMFRDRSSLGWKAYIILGLAVNALRFILQLAGVQELHETLWMTHLMIGLLAVVTLIQAILQWKKGGMDAELKRNMGWISFLLFITALEILFYRIQFRTVSIASLGFLLYILVGAAENVKKVILQIRSYHENEIYRTMAFTDGLTGMLNRAALNRDMAKWEETQDKSGVPQVIVMMDLDNLKKCNDHFGHKTGDLYIITAAGMIDETFGGKGSCYRLGGDEFCAWLGKVTEAEVKQMVEEIHRKVAEQVSGRLPVKVSISVGYAFCHGEQDVTMDDAMRRADGRMYEEKEARKRLETAESGNHTEIAESGNR